MKLLRPASADGPAVYYVEPEEDPTAQEMFDLCPCAGHWTFAPGGFACVGCGTIMLLHPE